MADSLDRARAALKRRGVAADALSWWDRHRRDLPWRARPGERPDPYRVWLSEVLLQQTTATGAAPYFLEFMRRWPTVEALAAAPLEEVMRVFAGLGYYSRARNLHACAKRIAARGGRFPGDEAALRELPGVGPYTAAAIAAIAFDKPAAPVDGNIARVVSRLGAFAVPIAANRAAIEVLANALTPLTRAGDYAQALMDIGATICRPAKPDCARCPLSRACLAARTASPESYPPRRERKPRPTRVGAAFYAERADGAFLARRRPPHGLLASTMELPTGIWAEGEIETVGPEARRSRRLGGACRAMSSTYSPISPCGWRFLSAMRSSTRRRRDTYGSICREIAEAGFSGLMRKAAAAAASALPGAARQKAFDAPCGKRPS